MELLQLIRKWKIFPEHRLLEFYPPFFFMGVKVVSVSSDFRHLRAKLPLRWYGKNLHGTMFGGFIAAAADPIPAILCSKVFPGTEVWTKAQCVDFKRPGKGHLEFKVEITDSDVKAISELLGTRGKGSHTFVFSLFDERKSEVAEVRNTIYIRKGKTGE